MNFFLCCKHCVIYIYHSDGHVGRAVQRAHVPAARARRVAVARADAWRAWAAAVLFGGRHTHRDLVVLAVRV